MCVLCIIHTYQIFRNTDRFLCCALSGMTASIKRKLTNDDFIYTNESIRQSF